MRKLMGFAIFLSAATAQAAGAPVEERGPDFSVQSQTAAAPQRVAQGGANQAVVDLHYDIQQLREEVRQLRGTVEEQAHELRQLRQRQMDDYQDLDRRISGGGGGGGTPVAAGSSAATAGQSPASAQNDLDSSFAPAGNSGQEPAEDPGELAAYTETYNLLKARKIDEAVAGFRNLVAKYPNGKYTANSYYWLGEIYLLQNNLPEAEKAFGTVTVNFPAHRKAPDAMFKLGRVYHLQGQNDKARELLGKVAAGNSNAASLARAYLNENF